MKQTHYIAELPSCFPIHIKKLLFCNGKSNNYSQTSEVCNFKSTKNNFLKGYIRNAKNHIQSHMQFHGIRFLKFKPARKHNWHFSHVEHEIENNVNVDDFPCNMYIYIYMHIDGKRYITFKLYITYKYKLTTSVETFSCSLLRGLFSIVLSLWSLTV